jgi:phenylalanyl-tRNA synthetase alpha chain
MDDNKTVTAMDLISNLLEIQREAIEEITSSDATPEKLKLIYLGKNSELAGLTQQLRLIPKAEIARVGIVVKEVKQAIENAINGLAVKSKNSPDGEFDYTVPGIKPPVGHLHIVSQAIMEITRIFERIGFTRVRHPEVDWDYYTFEALNMPPDHPARDEWETFFIQNPISKIQNPKSNSKYKKIVLTPHTSNGQVREMEKGTLPIRMINIAKCYRRQSDVSHAPMFHQFEGLYIDKNVSIAHLKGVCDYFFSQFYGPDRKSRLRPFHFQFTEPSFEIDVNCGLCGGTGILKNGDPCRMCKEGWLELGGAGMVHPNVLRAGGIDPDIYSGFAFGWGVERTYMMKSGTKIDDIRILYENDIRFLEQF